MGSMMHCKPWVSYDILRQSHDLFGRQVTSSNSLFRMKDAKEPQMQLTWNANVRRVLKCGCCNYEFCKPEFAMIYWGEDVSLHLSHIVGEKSKLKLWTAWYSVMVLFWATFFFWIIVIHSMTTANMLLRRLRRNFSQLSHLLGCHHWAFCILARAVKWLGFANSSQEQLFGLIAWCSNLIPVQSYIKLSRGVRSPNANPIEKKQKYLFQTIKLRQKNQAIVCFGVLHNVVGSALQHQSS